MRVDVDQLISRIAQLSSTDKQVAMDVGVCVGIAGRVSPVWSVVEPSRTSVNNPDFHVGILPMTDGIDQRLLLRMLQTPTEQFGEPAQVSTWELNQARREGREQIVHLFWRAPDWRKLTFVDVVDGD